MFTIIVPIYNKEGILESSINGFVGCLKKIFRKNWQMVLAELGSSDGSAKIARMLAKENKHVKFMHFQKNVGIVLVFRKILKIIKGDVIIIEPELTNNVDRIDEIVKGLKDEVNGPDIFNGSRFVKGAKYYASFVKRIFERIRNMLANIKFKTKLSDLQCEFKGYREKVFRHLCLTSDANQASWFTESLVRAAKMDYEIREFPVIYGRLK